MKKFTKVFVTFNFNGTVWSYDEIVDCLSAQNLSRIFNNSLIEAGANSLTEVDTVMMDFQESDSPLDDLLGAYFPNIGNKEDALAHLRCLIDELGDVTGKSVTQILYRLDELGLEQRRIDMGECDLTEVEP